MKFDMQPPFELRSFERWFSMKTPVTIEIHDSAYAWLAGMMRQNITEYKGAKFIFLDGPK